jgi:maltose phosphorylase
MKNGILYRNFTCKIKNIEVQVKTERFISIDQKNLGAIKYSVKVNKACEIILKPYIDNDVINLDSNYNESF